MLFLTLSWNQYAIKVVLGKPFVLQVFSLELLELGLTCCLLNDSVVLFYDLSWADSNASSCSHFPLIGTSITVILSNLIMTVTLTMSRKFICENWSLHVTQWMIICVALQRCPDSFGQTPWLFWISVSFWGRWVEDGVDNTFFYTKHITEHDANKGIVI